MGSIVFLGVPDPSHMAPPTEQKFQGLVPTNALGYEIENWRMLFATAIGGRFYGKEQDEA